MFPKTTHDPPSPPQKGQSSEGSAAAAEPRLSFDGTKRIPNLNLATEKPEAPSAPSVFDAPVSPPEPTTTTTTTTQRQDTGHLCTNNYFMCSNGQFIMCDRICNGVSDCQDGSDELACPTESTTQYGVAESRASLFGGDPIINLNLAGETDVPPSPPSVFDAPVQSRANLGGGGTRIFDLNLQPDEPETTSTATNEIRRPSCTGKLFICDNGQHIMCYKTCNSVQDCSDGSDERFCQGWCSQRQESIVWMTYSLSPRTDN